MVVLLTLAAGRFPRVRDEAFDAYADARINGPQNALALLAVLDVIALCFAQRIPRTQPGRAGFGP